MKDLLTIALIMLIPLGADGAVAGGSKPLMADLLSSQPVGDLISGITRISTKEDETVSTLSDSVRSGAESTGQEQKPPESLAGKRPPARVSTLPRTRWQHRPNNRIWTRAALSALKAHGAPLVTMDPGDIANWCPAYASNPATERRAFWVGFLSALAKYESTYKAGAVGGGGKWYGLLQILPGTARGYRCHARTGAALKNGAANLSCAIRIMAVTVPRDGVIYGRGGRGVAADWGPMRSKSKRSEMAGWLRRQNYCKPLAATRPRSRP